MRPHAFAFFCMRMDATAYFGILKNAKDADIDIDKEIEKDTDNDRESDIDIVTVKDREKETDFTSAPLLLIIQSSR